jgi:uncharacterized tellurite resistance protein B-like protein
MASVAHRINILIDLFMGAVYADQRCENQERGYVRALVADLLCTEELPPAVDALIENFDPQGFSLPNSVTDFLREPPMNKRRLMELVAYVTMSDGAQTPEEDTYLRDLGVALGMNVEEYRHLTSDPDMAHLRESFTDLARIPLPV